MNAIRNNLAFILLAACSVLLVYFLLRLQTLITETEQPAAVETVDAAVALPPNNQQPTTPPAAPTLATPLPALPATPLPAQPAAIGNIVPISGPLTVGAIHVGSVNDRGYNQAHNEGLQQMAAQLPDVRVIRAENVPETEAVLGVVNQMIGQGARVIFAQSYGYLPHIMQAAEANPDIIFLHSGGFELRPNLGTYWANSYEAMYLAGIAAGATSAAGQLGVVAAFPVPHVLASVNAFHLGARSVNPAISTQLVIIDRWVDPAREEQAVSALASMGVDTVVALVNSPVTVLQRAESLGLYSIGFHHADLREYAPRGWLTGAAHSWGNYYTSVIQQIRSGEWQSSHIRGGIGSNMVQLAPFGATVATAVQNRVRSTQAGIISGQVAIFQGPIVDNRGLEQIPAGQIADIALLNTTDWLIDGIAPLDANRVAGSDAAASGSSSTPVPATTAALVQPTADLILGLPANQPACAFVSAVMVQLIERDLALTVETATFADADAMYAAIANRQTQRLADLTACFRDPADRPALRNHFGFVKHIGDTVWRGAATKLQILAHAGFSVELERDQSCLYRFLRNVQFTDAEVTGESAEEWLAANASRASRWTSCELLP